MAKQQPEKKQTLMITGSLSLVMQPIISKKYLSGN